MMKYSKIILIVLVAALVGALIMDYYNFLKAKDKNYSKISGFFKYSSQNLI